MPRSLFSGTTIEIKSMFENVNPQSLLNSYSNLLFFNDVTNTILRFNELFVQGDFTNLLIEYEKNYRITSYQLNIFYNTNINDPIISGIIQLLSDILNNITQGTIQYNNLQNLNLSLKSCQEKSSILDSIESINNYLNQLKRTNNLFSTNITSAPVIIKQEYLIYIQRYGLPAAGVFDTLKLGEIISELNR